jgi:hypothetical protein
MSTQVIHFDSEYNLLPGESGTFGNTPYPPQRYYTCVRLEIPKGFLIEEIWCGAVRHFHHAGGSQDIALCQRILLERHLPGLDIRLGVVNVGTDAAPFLATLTLGDAP